MFSSSSSLYRNFIIYTNYKYHHHYNKYSHNKSSSTFSIFKNFQQQFKQKKLFENIIQPQQQQQKLTMSSTITTESNLLLNYINNNLNEKNLIKSIEYMKRIKLGGRLRKDYQYKKASVLIPFCYNNNIPSILFTRRSFKITKHKGEVCFPGGIEEECDATVIESAIRETIEEIGVDRNDIKIYGDLNPIPFNELALYPVIGYLKLYDNQNGNNNQFKLNPDEVQSIHIIPIERLLNYKYWFKTHWRSGWTTPVYKDDENPRIWGMTASILYMLLTNIFHKHFHFDSSYINRGPISPSLATSSSSSSTSSKLDDQKSR